MSKVAIIGSGFVGSTTAYALFIKRTASEIAIFDPHREKAEGHAMDLEHGLQFSPGVKITFGDSYDICAGAEIVVITAGAHQNPGETRLDLVSKNSGIFNDMIPKIAKSSPNSIFLIVSNPVDIMTYLALKYSGFPRERVFGTGTTLDTARYRYYLAEHFNVSPQSVHAYILGEHGDSEFPVLSGATIAGLNIKDTWAYDKAKLDDDFKKTKNAAYEIISRKGATYFAIALVIAEIVQSILHDEKRVFPVSTFIENYYDEGDLCMSVPCAIGKGGIQRRIQLPLSEEEQAALHNSAGVLREILNKVK
ncbi:MAG TPA: L-lactate dehydrogenase [Candidatus Nanoarchaeia archaeon]|nr:L-lactate dehydrogenase [Candidatus Nanoarchaeia archaeon]